MKMLPRGRIAICSGSGTEEGTWKEYTGSRTEKALKSHLTRERCHGQRWAFAYLETDLVNRFTGEKAFQQIYWEKDQYGNSVLRLGDDMCSPNLS